MLAIDSRNIGAEQDSLLLQVRIESCWLICATLRQAKCHEQRDAGVETVCRVFVHAALPARSGARRG